MLAANTDIEKWVYYFIMIDSKQVGSNFHFLVSSLQLRL